MLEPFKDTNLLSDLAILTFRLSSFQSLHKTDLNVALVRDWWMDIQSSHTTIPSSSDAHTGSVIIISIYWITEMGMGVSKIRRKGQK